MVFQSPKTLKLFFIINPILIFSGSKKINFDLIFFSGSLQQPTLSSFGRNLTHQKTAGPIENSLRIPSGFPPNSMENSLGIPSGFPQNSLRSPCFEPEQKEPLALVIKKEPTEPVQKISKSDKQKETNTDQDMGENDKQINNENNVNKKGNNGKQRNYKNMTRERRVEANARERQRVQTITGKLFSELQINLLFILFIIHAIVVVLGF